MTADRIPALLEPIQNRLNAATPIELEVAGTEPSMSGQHFSIRRKGIPGLRITGHEYGHGGVYTDLLVHAPTDQARLLAAVKAVTEVHKPAKVQRTKYNADGTLISYTVTEDGPCVVCYPPFITQHCEECEDYDETCGGVTGAASRPWPCPTVAAVVAALGGEA